MAPSQGVFGGPDPNGPSGIPPFTSLPLFGTPAQRPLLDPTPKEWKENRFEVRAIVNGHEATDSFYLSVAKRQTPKDVLCEADRYWRSKPWLARLRATISLHLFTDSCPRILILQGAVRKKDFPWSTPLGIGDTGLFERWLDKFVKTGTHSVRRIEIHLSTFYLREFVSTIDGGPRFTRTKDNPDLRRYVRFDAVFEWYDLHERYEKEHPLREAGQLPPMDEETEEAEYSAKEMEEAIPTMRFLKSFGQTIYYHARPNVFPPDTADPYDGHVVLIDEKGNAVNGKWYPGCNYNGGTW